jgi:hypothetical protein
LVCREWLHGLWAIAKPVADPPGKTGETRSGQAIFNYSDYFTERNVPGIVASYVSPTPHQMNLPEISTDLVCREWLHGLWAIAKPVADPPGKTGETRSGHRML